MTKANKVWFVTGASKGLGLALVKRLLKEGFQVAATSRNKAALLDAVGAENENFLPLEVNLSSEASLNSAVASTLKHFKTIDVLVNNAGYGQGGAVEEVTDEEVRKNYEVNVFGLLNVTRAVLPVMRKNKSGHVFNISSIGGYVSAFSGWGVYCSTKFAVSAITEALHTDVKDLGINVTLIYPGYFRTNFLDKESMMLPSRPISDYISSKDSMDQHVDSINNNQPGDPEKAAGALIQLTKEGNPPLHMFLGKDAVQLAQVKIESFSAEVKAWKHLSESTDF
jgi:NAD(P)-dependent dehydrogenase (short-subunit alcohol dehydrogenase family)